MKPILSVLLLVVAIIVEASADQNDMFPLQRISRSSLPLSALLVPYPRVGKRSTEMSDDSQMETPMSVAKRLYVARVGKRAYMYAARVGK